MNKKRKRRKYLTVSKRRRLMINITLLLILFIGLGYSVLGVDLNILGNIKVNEYMEPTLYNVLQKAASKGYAREYTGEHHDSFTEEPSQKIYHWYADTDAAGNQKATEILDKNNVLFADQCWQMIRTTDTGGVKMIYNGEAEDGKCLNTRGTHVGYDNITNDSMTENYWYGTDYIYDNITNSFKLSGTTEQSAWNQTTSQQLVGKYTCKSTNVDATCSTLLLMYSFYDTTIAHYNDPNAAYVIKLSLNSNYSQFGTLRFSRFGTSLADVGYMYNTRYHYEQVHLKSGRFILGSSLLNTNFWFGDTVTWDSSSNRYSLNNPYQVSSTADYPNLVGKYTFRNTTQTYTNTSVYYIAAVDGSTMYYIDLGNQSGSTHDLNYYNDTYTYGDNYTDNGDGTYTINSPTTINRSDWYTSYNNIKNKYICINATNNTCNELLYVGETSKYQMDYVNVANNYKYAKGFTWDGNKYILNNESVSFWNVYDSTSITNINNYHYTCFNTTGECTTLSYIYYSFSDFNASALNYLILTNGKSVDEAINEMLYNNNVNTIDSVIKVGVDSWYKKYLTGYTSKLEDTIYCNDRDIAELNGWNFDQGDVSRENLKFKNYSSNSDLSCTNITDQFSLANTKAQLTYPTGLLTYPEVQLLNNFLIRKVGQSYWLASPSKYDSEESHNRCVYSDGDILNDCAGGNNHGVRPVISLRPGTEYVDGDGSMENPYYVGEMYNISSSSNLVPKKSPPDYTVTLGNEEYAVTSFKLDGTLVNGDSFVMPHHDVTIIDVQSIPAYYTITSNDSDINVPDCGRYGSTIELTSDNYRVDSFKLNGTLITGNSFVMPGENVTITDIQKTPQVIVESEHNPYANSIDNVTYYENTFAGATSLTVELTYQTESTSYDWIYLYDSADSTTPFNNKKYGGTTQQTETITIPSNYLKIVFRTDGSGNNYYGFKAVITPNYD